MSRKLPLGLVQHRLKFILSIKLNNEPTNIQQTIFTTEKPIYES